MGMTLLCYFPLSSVIPVQLLFEYYFVLLTQPFYTHRFDENRRIWYDVFLFGNTFIFQWESFYAMDRTVIMVVSYM